MSQPVGKTELPLTPKDVVAKIRTQFRESEYDHLDDVFDATVGNHSDGISAGYARGVVDALDAVEETFASLPEQPRCGFADEWIEAAPFEPYYPNGGMDGPLFDYDQMRAAYDAGKASVQSFRDPECRCAEAGCSHAGDAGPVACEHCKCTTPFDENHSSVAASIAEHEATIQAQDEPTLPYPCPADTPLGVAYRQGIEVGKGFGFDAGRKGLSWGEVSMASIDRERFPTIQAKDDHSRCETLRELLKIIIKRGDFYSVGHSDEKCVRAVQRAKELLG